MLADCWDHSDAWRCMGKPTWWKGYAQFKHLQEAMPSIEFVGDLDEDVVMAAMSTKDADEIERIRQMGKVTTRVVGGVADFLSSRPVKNGVLMGPDGEQLTIGEVKNRIKSVAGRRRR